LAQQTRSLLASHSLDNQRRSLLDSMELDGFVYHSEREEFHKRCAFRDRLDSDASTACPSDEDVSEEFEFNGSKYIKVLPTVRASQAVLPTDKPGQSATRTHEYNGSLATGATLFLLTLFGLIIYGLLHSTCFRLIMGAVAALIVSPGLYLYVVQGCRPEDYKEEGNDSQQRGGLSVLALALLIIAVFYGVRVSTVFRFFMGAMAASMLLPGLYLYAVHGCRPEEFDRKEE